VQDLIFIAVILAFFALLWLFILGCERIIGSDEQALGDHAEPTGPDSPVEDDRRAA